MSLFTTVGATLAAAVLSVGSIAGTSSASASTTRPHDDLGKQWTTACGRVSRQIARVEKVQARLEASSDTPGSIARLQARIDKARAAGNSDLATLLTDRLAVRKDIDATLPGVLARLKDAQSECSAHPATGTPSGSATS